MMASSVPPTLKLLSSVIRHGRSKQVKSLHLSSSTQRYCNMLVFAHRPVTSPAPVTVTTVTNFHTSLVCHKKKKKEKPKKGGKKQTSTAYDDEEDSDDEVSGLRPDLDELFNIEEIKAEMMNIVNDLRSEYAEKLALRTNQSAFSNLQISLPEGKKTALQYLGQITMKPPSTVVINLAANHQYVAHVRDALKNSALNVNPRIDGHTIFVETPKITRELREALSKNAKTLADKHKVMMREVQNNKIKQLRAVSKTYSIDEVRACEKDILKMVKDFGTQIDKYLKIKQAELIGGD